MNVLRLMIVAILLFSFPILATAQTIYACAKNSNGRLRVVSAANQCRNSETPISWNSTGPEGPQGGVGPQGPQGDIGLEGPTGIPGSSGTMFQFVGVTTTTHVGGSGIRTFTEACQQDYPGSRMCSSKEYIETVDFPAKGSFFGAWIRPTFSPIAAGGITAADISGITSQPFNFTCGGWRSVGQALGLSVSDAGQFGIGVATCGSSIPIACCAPPQ